MLCNWLKNRERIVLSRTEKGFLLSKAVVSVALTVFCLQVNEQKGSFLSDAIQTYKQSSALFYWGGEFSYPF